MRQTDTEILRSPSGVSLQYFQDGSKEFLQTLNGVSFPIYGNIICFLDNIKLTGNNGNYQKMYDRFSGFYDIATHIYAFFKNGNEKHRVMQYLSLLDIKNGDRVVEISIGTGRNIVHLNPLADYYGIDISSGMLKQCQRKMELLKREITLLQAEAEDLPVKDGSFDVVFSAGGFNFFNDPGKAVLEMLRIAKPGVKILITDETEKFRLKHSSNKFYRNEIKNPQFYLPDYCKEVDYKEISNGDLYALTFRKP
jgi:ubiquinone/menaquinone biosynthesis C-methylase UbiE